MYTVFFGLKREPFSIAPDPRYLFMSDHHREALAHLLYGVNGGGGFVLLTGEVGAGKTTVCRAFLEQVPKQCHVAYIFNPKLSVIEMLQTVCEEFAIVLDSVDTLGLKACIDKLNTFLLQNHAKGESCILIIDEAQNLSPEVLEQLRLLTNLETSERKLLQIILIGQPELRDLIMQPSMEQMAQRVIARYHLSALTQSETAQYVAHRLAVAGWNDVPLFDAKALKRIYELTRGIPRCVNVLCDRALLGAYVCGQKTVGSTIVHKAASELYNGFSNEYTPKSQQARHLGLLLPKWLWGMLGATVVICLIAAGVFALQQYAYNATAAQSKVAARQAQNVAARASVAGLAPTAMPLMASVANLHELNAWLVNAPTQDDITWQSLARFWQLDVGARDPCNELKQQQVQCFRSAGGLDLIRQLQRPSSLGLFDREGRSVFAILTKLTHKTATLQFGVGTQTQHITVTLTDLAKVWRGDFFTLWRSPPGYKQRLEAGRSGLAVTWLAQHLAQWLQQPIPEGQRRYDSTLQAKVHAFQITQGIKPDGIAGAMTLMQLNRLTGVNEPRLITETQIER